MPAADYIYKFIYKLECTAYRHLRCMHTYPPPLPQTRAHAHTQIMSSTESHGTLYQYHTSKYLSTYHTHSETRNVHKPMLWVRCFSILQKLMLDEHQWQASVNKVMYLHAPKRPGFFLTSWVTTSFSRRTLLHRDNAGNMSRINKI
jgi:hypothetical protein